MRKTKCECNDPAFFDEMFSTVDDLCLAMHDGEYPYVLPLNFVRQGQGDHHALQHAATELEGE